MQVICSKRTLAQPSSDNIELLFYQCCCVPISSHWWITMCLFRLDPYILLCIKNSQTTVIFLPIIASKDPKFALVKRCSVIFNLRSATHDRSEGCLSRWSWSTIILPTLCSSRLRIVISSICIIFRCRNLSRCRLWNKLPCQFCLFSG